MRREEPESSAPVITARLVGETIREAIPEILDRERDSKVRQKMEALEHRLLHLAQRVRQGLLSDGESEQVLTQIQTHTDALESLASESERQPHEDERLNPQLTEVGERLRLLAERLEARGLPSDALRNAFSVVRGRLAVENEEEKKPE